MNVRYKWIRNEDRKKNQYPELTYPDIYVLEKGYEDFYKNHKVRGNAH